MPVIKIKYLDASGLYNAFLFFVVGLNKTLIETDDTIVVDIHQELLKLGMTNTQSVCYRKRSCIIKHRRHYHVS